MTESEQIINIDNLRQISEILTNTLHISNDDVKQLIKANPRILNIEPNELRACLQTFLEELNVNPQHIISTLYKNIALFQNKAKLDYVRKIIGREFYMSPKRMGFGLLQNPSLLAMDISHENFETYVKTIVKNCGVDIRFVRNLFAESNIFGRSYFEPENFAETLNKRITILNIFGLSISDITNRPSIIANNTTSMRRRLKLAMLSGQDIKEYAQNKFRVNENIIWARWCAQNNGQYSINASIYARTNEFEALSEISQIDAMALYPLDPAAIKVLDKEFKEKFPEIDESLRLFYEQLHKKTPTRSVDEPKPTPEPSATTNETEQKAETAEKTDTEEHSSNYSITRAKRILGVNDLGLETLKVSLGIQEFDEKILSDILANFVTLNKYGFSTPEILANPKCLTLELSDLELRIKLSRINNRTNLQFLSRDYKFGQQTIFARTCGIKILTRSNVNVYDSEKRFAAKFGGDTETLIRLCVLDQKGIDVLNRLYEKATPKETTEELE